MHRGPPGLSSLLGVRLPRRRQNTQSGRLGREGTGGGAEVAGGQQEDTQDRGNRVSAKAPRTRGHPKWDLFLKTLFLVR